MYISYSNTQTDTHIHTFLHKTHTFTEQTHTHTQHTDRRAPTSLHNDNMHANYHFCSS